MRTVPVILALMFLAATALAADVELSLPLDGHYRPGKYIPVTIRLTNPATIPMALELEADGYTRTVVHLNRRAQQVTVPILPLTDPSPAVRWRATDSELSGSMSVPMRPMASDDRLVGWTRPAPDLANTLFPGSKVIPVQLDADDLLATSPSAWMTLDALVLDRATYDKLHPVFCDTLLANGTTFAVEQVESPDSAWPWEKIGTHWALRYVPAGPRAGGVNPDAFAPVQGWRAESPGYFRRRLLLSAVIYSVLLLGATLLPRRWTLALAITLSLAFLGIFAALSRTRPPVQHRTATVVADGGDFFTQTDRWTYCASPAMTAASVPFGALSLPFFTSTTGLNPGWMELSCDEKGTPRTFIFTLVPGRTVAFLAREPIKSTLEFADDRPAPRPLLDLARRLYLTPSLDVLGRVPGPDPADSLTTEHLGSIRISSRSRRPPSSAPTTQP